ncbi:unnamed protein product [Amoebophrya sp. A25]|nr:unnamed protein product [Amoebophrya sp. A25]|eukprot:GSA25T00023695001.1
MYLNLYHGRRGRSHVVVEMGALDGLRFSNSYAFEYELGWRSVLIEGSAGNFAALQKNRPNATAIFGAACAKVSTIKIPGSGPTASAHDGPASTGDTPCMPMSMLLGRAGVDRVDFFSLDVEGAELAAIESHDYMRVPVNAYLIEMRPNAAEAEKNSRVRKALADRGFCRLAVNVGHKNEVWVSSKWVEP